MTITVDALRSLALQHRFQPKRQCLPKPIQGDNISECARARLTIVISATLKLLSGPQVRQVGPASIRLCRERKNRLRRANRLNRTVG